MRNTTFILGLLTSVLVPNIAVAQETFPDVPTTHPYFQAIQYVKEQGIVEGYTNPSDTSGQVALYKPENPINRAEFTKILIGASEYASSVSGSNCFPDVQNEWFAGFVCTAKEHNIIAGHPDGTFHPADNINTAEAAKILVNTFSVTLSSPKGDTSEPWYAPYITALDEIGALPATAADPSHLLTRGEMAEMIHSVKTSTDSYQSSSPTSSASEQVTKLPFAFSMQDNWSDLWGLQTIGIPDVYATEVDSDDKQSAAWYEKVDTQNVELRSDDAEHASYMRIHLPKGGYNPIDAKQGGKPLGGVNLFASANIEPLQLLYLQYYIRLPEGFDFSRSGYLPGIGGGISNEYGVFGSSDFSQNILWEKDGRIKMYASNRDGYVTSSEPLPADGQWHKVDMKLELNTVNPVRSNGTIELRIDNKLFIQSDTASIRSGPSVLIEGVAFNVIYGVAGSYATPKKDLYVDIADMRISKFAF